MSKFVIECKWMTEDKREHGSKEHANRHQVLLEAVKDAGYSLESEDAERFVSFLKKLSEVGGWTL